MQTVHIIIVGSGRVARELERLAPASLHNNEVKLLDILPALKSGDSS